MQYLNYIWIYGVLEDHVQEDGAGLETKSVSLN